MRTVATSRSISIQAAPEAVVSLLGDARQLPRWAPGFAHRVVPDGGEWAVEMGDGTRVPVAVRVCPEHGTVDVLVTRAAPRGAYLRVLGTGAAAEVVLTVIAPAPADAAEAARMQQVVDEELQAVRDLAEGKTRVPEPARGTCHDPRRGHSDVRALPRAHPVSDRPAP